MGLNTSTNATAAKVIGAGTIGIALLLSSEWGIASATALTAAGSVLVVGAGDELARLSIRNFVLFVGYWGLLMVGIGLGA
jgi:hypothetical protein